MKKILPVAAIVATSMLASSCSTGSLFGKSNGLNQEVVAGALAGAAANGLANGSNNNSIGGLGSAGLSILGNLLGLNSVNANTIVGTWTYTQPQVSFESKNVLSGIGGEFMANQIEENLSKQLVKIGMKPGVTKFTFDKNGKVSVTLGSKTTTGTYTLNGDQLTMTGALGMTNTTCTVTISGGQLYMLYDAPTLFNALTKLSASSSTISNMLKNFNGMKLGWSCSK